MKKILLAAVLAFSAATGIGSLISQNMEASAKTHAIKASLVKNLKKGTLPNASGKIGDTYTSVHKKAKGAYMNAGDPPFYSAKNGDNYSFYEEDPIYSPKKAKVGSISRWYDYKISQKSIEKHFGKAYKGYENGEKVKNTHVYKTGKYYTYIEIIKTRTLVIVGTKSGVSDQTFLTDFHR